MRLTGKVGIVTGANQGIGRATALRWAEEGATVVCADIKEGCITHEEIEAKGGTAVTVIMDVRVADDWTRARRRRRGALRHRRPAGEHGRRREHAVARHRRRSHRGSVGQRLGDRPQGRLARHARGHPDDAGQRRRTHRQHLVARGAAGPPEPGVVLGRQGRRDRADPAGGLRVRRRRHPDQRDRARARSTRRSSPTSPTR